MKINDLIIYPHMEGYIYRVIAMKAGEHTVSILTAPHNDYVRGLEYNVIESILPSMPEVMECSPLEYVIYGIPYEV